MSKVRDDKSIKSYLQILLIISVMISFSQTMPPVYISEQSGTLPQRSAMCNSVAQGDLASNLHFAFDRTHLSWDTEHNASNLEGNYTAAGSTFSRIEGSFSIPASTNILLIPDVNISYSSSELNEINTWFNEDGPRLLWVGGDSDYAGYFQNTACNELLAYLGTNLRLSSDGINDPIYNDGASYRVAAQTPVSDGVINSIVTTDVSSVIMHAPCSILGYNNTTSTVIDLAQSSINNVEVIMRGSTEIYSQDQDLSDGEFDYYATNNINGSYPLMAIQTMGHKKHVIVSGEVIYSDYRRMYDLITDNGFWNGGVHDGKTLVDNVFSWFGKEISTLDVACVFGPGGLTDPFNEMVYAGILEAQTDELCAFDYALPSEPADIEGLLDNYASTGNYDLIIAVGVLSKIAAGNIAVSYPSQRILLMDDIFLQGNISSLVFKEHEGSFLVGAMAGLMTQTGKIGFVGGDDVPLIRKFWAGFKAGALYVRNNSFIKVIEDFVATYDPDNPWNNPARGKAIAESMWSQGVDIIYTAAGKGTGAGVHESANTLGSGFYSIGVDYDEDYMYPGSILTSMLKKFDTAVYQVIEALHSGIWTPGIQEKGLAEDGVGISPLTYTKDIIGDTIIDEVNVTLRNKIVSGELTVPYNATSLIQWIDDLNLVIPAYPDFNELVSYDFSQIGDDFQFTVTIRNTGDPTSAGFVPISWEESYYELPLNNGDGILDESLANYDINGDGDKLDSFDVVWSPNETRPYDALVDGMHVYSLTDGTDLSVRSYYINGDPKSFQLGSETHILYRADNDFAHFGFNTVFQAHPSPNFELIFYFDVSATEFKINGDPALLDFNWTSVEKWVDGSIREVSVYVFSSSDLSSLATGEEVTMSCTFTPQGIGTPSMYLLVNWSPDGNTRKQWIPFWHELAPPSFTTSLAGKTLSGVVEISWMEAKDSMDHERGYDLFYSPDNGKTWIKLESRFWDTTTVADGSDYLLKLVTTCSEGFYVEIVTEKTFSIQNDITPTTTTPTKTTTAAPTTTSEEAASIGTPGLTGLILLFTISTLTISRKKRKNNL
ncbi:MAG: BMP family protein [Candidatus Hodarchaeota archaeon]